ncbi:hypothetical protein DFP72DRAFT_1066693 [Ephemerocybe angulata]|uniref:Uncharacterized protein n=1 Tax=Ephemerocybe angulata TaxID=980116 RepID=A0A8H6I1R8_9AGAR|nr:hypothetical protein DFP72DRAFT_1066693 [Tulosesus angulatus]
MDIKLEYLFPIAIVIRLASTVFFVVASEGLPLLILCMLSIATAGRSLMIALRDGP